MKKCLLATVAALTFTGGAAAATPIMWTPAHMAKALTALNYPQGVISGTCHGTSQARKGAFSGFRCAMTWQILGTDGGTTSSGKATVYAKPLVGGGVCGSTISLSRCAVLARGPLAGDPHVCNGASQDACIVPNAVQAMRRHIGGPGGLYQGTTSCNVTSNTPTTIRLDCMAGPTAESVTFTKGVSSWTTSVTP